MSNSQNIRENTYDERPPKIIRPTGPSFLDANRLAAHLAEELQRREKINEGRNSKLCLLGAISGSLVLLLMTSAAVFLALHHSSPQRPASLIGAEAENGKPLRFEQKYVSVPLAEINKIPLDQVEKIATMVFKWGEDEYGGPREFYFTVESLFRDIVASKTTVRLSSGHRLVATSEDATLLDDQGKILGLHDFRRAKETMENMAILSKNPATTPPQSDDADIDQLIPTSRRTWTKGALAKADVEPPTRILGKKGKKSARVNEPGPGGNEDAYCMYGCGQMGVTYPYYYRPFFGYGYPLVGLERMFEPGYGGNPVTQLAREGIINSANSPGPFTPTGVL